MSMYSSFSWNGTSRLDTKISKQLEVSSPGKGGNEQSKGGWRWVIDSS